MIDFNNASFVKLRSVGNTTYQYTLENMLLEEENIIATYQGIRDGVVFTDKRIIAINVQGLVGKKQSITTLPYSKIQAFSTETSGVLDLDSELELWFSGLGKIKLEFSSNTNMARVFQIISERIL